jgi:hypothetical protein
MVISSFDNTYIYYFDMLCFIFSFFFYDYKCKQLSSFTSKLFKDSFKYLGRGCDFFSKLLIIRFEHTSFIILVKNPT